jgi:hypothetical protein
LPSELLCERSEGANRPRLSVLATQLGCDAFYLGVYDRVVGMLLEANAAGLTFVSGSFGPDIPSEQFYDEQIDDTELISRFSLLKVSERLQEAIQINEDPELQRIEAEVRRLIEREAYADLSVFESSIDRIDEFQQGYTERIDGAFQKVIHGSNDWYSAFPIYNIYTKSEELVAKEAKLLYFQPPVTYKPREPYVLTQAQLAEILGVAGEQDEF